MTTNLEALIMMLAADGLHTFIPAGAVRDLKTVVMKDENLSWKEFNEAVHG